MEQEKSWPKFHHLSLDHGVDVKGKMRERALHSDHANDHAAQAASGSERAVTVRHGPDTAVSGRI